MRRLFSLFPLLLPLPNLVLAAEPVCTLENRVCAENNNSGKCIRYENTFTCVTLNPAGSRCTVDANPTLTDCTLSAPVCSAESGGICLETTTDFVCKSEPSGEGIRIDDTSVTVSYSKETKGEIPAGCIIGAEVCLDDDARDIEVENWEGHFVSANPVCWVTERTIRQSRLLGDRTHDPLSLRRRRGLLPEARTRGLPKAHRPRLRNRGTRRVRALVLDLSLHA